MSQRADFDRVFARLRSILARHESRLDVIHDRPDNYYLNTRTIGPNTHPIAFGGVKVGKSYVSYYLMPVYTQQGAFGISAALRKRMQGKACFNFKTVDDELFVELEELTQRGYDAWKKLEWVD